MNSENAKLKQEIKLLRELKEATYDKFISDIGGHYLLWDKFDKRYREALKNLEEFDNKKIGDKNGLESIQNTN